MYVCLSLRGRLRDSGKFTERAYASDSEAIEDFFLEARILRSYYDQVQLTVKDENNRLVREQVFQSPFAG